MGSFGSKLARALSLLKHSPSRIAMIGLDAAGKTTILYRFKLKETITTLPTVGFNIETLTPIKGLTLNVWDIGGQDRMRPLWRMYLRETDGVMFVVDSADRERIPEAKDELMRVLNTQEMRNVPLVVVANKQDLPGALDSSQLSKILGLHEMTSRRWVIYDACATNGHGVCESMESLAKLVEEYKSKHH